MGLSSIFSEKANFSGMMDSTEPICVSKVVQKAFIEVNEEGAEAAAATGKTRIFIDIYLHYFFEFHVHLIISNN